MKVVDLNLLLYGINRDSVHHGAARSWLEATFSSGEAVGLPWVVILGFLRIATNPRILPAPLDVREAIAVVDGWLALPHVVVPEEGREHWTLLRALLDEAGAAGNLTTDAHLAALTIGHGAELFTADADFGRFRGLRWRNPLEE